ncbi:ThuA domain-containing protein [Paenibacillus soyae]|uniref:ThuA domain-containing protein n=1 Tax=Paenibacillus soyae TaxID=2969249 RepID=A0A9X2MRX4_9BACL|nr:ThuA domain-containing protein [Paenibacillus soyae]MCR2804646.1 ThuA domain-containing protein [Paenibacillus soyae]
MKVIGVICGDKWHPAADVLAGLREAVPSGFELEALAPEARLSVEWLADKDAVVLAKLNHTSEEDESPWLTAGIKEAIMDYVAGGGGLAVLHAGTVGYKEDPTFSRFIGGVFAYHPEPCRITLGVKPSAAPFPVQDSADIEIYDEHYIMDMADDSPRVFMTSASEHGMQAAGWTKRHGAGRVCVLTPGHFPDVWRQPGYRELLSQALRWCAGEAGETEPRG